LRSEVDWSNKKCGSTIEKRIGVIVEEDNYRVTKGLK